MASFDMKLFGRSILAAATLASAFPSAAATGPTTSDEARNWNQLHGMKAMDVMHMVDQDKKGYVTQEEFMKFQEQLFQRMDKNQDGKVDAAEWMGKPEAAASSATKKK